MDGTARHFTDELTQFASLSDELSAGPNKTGRKPLPPEQQKLPFSVRLTAAERELVVRASQHLGAGAPATWAREALIAAARSMLAFREEKAG